MQATKTVFKAAAIFSSNMVLQREKAITIWGKGENGRIVTAEVAGNTAKAVVADGKWEISLAPMNAGGPYELFLSAESLNQALANKNYKAVIENLNSLAYPMFQAHNVSSKIVNNKLYILLEYNFPIAPTPKNRVFVASSDFMVKNGKIKAVNVQLDSAYGKISLNKVANLLNLLNPLEFTVELLDSKKCDANIENVNIVDNKVKIDGKIFVKGE